MHQAHVHNIQSILESHSKRFFPRVDLVKSYSAISWNVQIAVYIQAKNPFRFHLTSWYGTGLV